MRAASKARESLGRALREGGPRGRGTGLRTVAGDSSTGVAVESAGHGGGRVLRPATSAGTAASGPAPGSCPRPWRQPQERRRMSFVGTAIVSGGRRPAADQVEEKLRPRAGRRRPAGSGWWRAAGTWAEAPGWSSKPTTATSSGTRRPPSARARIAPIAEVSLLARTAVNGLPAREDRPHRLEAAFLAVEAGGDEVLARVEAELAAQPAEVGEPRAAVAEVRAGRPRRTRRARCPCARRCASAWRKPGALSATTAGWPSPHPDEHDGEAVLLQRERIAAARRRAQGRDEDEAVGVPRSRRARSRPRRRGRATPGRTSPRVVDPRVDAAGEQHVAAERGARLGDAAQHGFEEPVGSRSLVGLPAGHDADRGPARVGSARSVAQHARDRAGAGLVSQG